MSLIIIYEHIVHEQLTEHFTTHKLFHGNHHGSISGHDTSTALIQANNFCLEAAEAKKLSATLLVDQTAAFDLVDHSMLLGKLEAYGSTANTSRWFSSYLAGRGFRVEVETSRSRKVVLGPYGVPQGSVLGSTIFVISKNDLPAATPETDDQQTIAYVDDTSEQAAAETPEDLMNIMQVRADNVAQWLADNRMIIAPTKTKLLVTATSQLRNARAANHDFSIMLGEVKVNATPSERLLGVTMSQDLMWLPHFWGESWRDEGNQPGVIPELLKRIGLLRYLSRVTSQAKMRSLVPGMFSSKLAYALHLTASIWGISDYSVQELNRYSCPKSVLLKLQSLQRQAAALLCTRSEVNYTTPTSSILEELNMPSVHQQAALQILRLAIRIINSSTQVPSRQTGIQQG